MLYGLGIMVDKISKKVIKMQENKMTKVYIVKSPDSVFMPVFLSESSGRTVQKDPIYLRIESDAYNSFDYVEIYILVKNEWVMDEKLWMNSPKLYVTIFEGSHAKIRTCYEDGWRSPFSQSISLPIRRHDL